MSSKRRFWLQHILYRQEFILKRMNIEISRASMAEWMIRVSELLSPLYDALQQMLIKQSSIQADETPIQVLNEPERTPQNKSCMWLYRTTGQPGSPVILYDYQTGRDWAGTLRLVPLRAGKTPSAAQRCQCRTPVANEPHIG